MNRFHIERRIHWGQKRLQLAIETTLIPGQENEYFTYREKKASLPKYDK